MRKSILGLLILSASCMMFSLTAFSVNADSVVIGDIEGTPVKLILSPSEGIPGASVRLYVFVENRFKDQLDRVVISISLPSDWKVSQTSRELTKIPARGARFGIFEIFIPLTASSGIYPVIVSVESDNSSVLASIDLTIKEEPTLVSLISGVIISFFTSPVGIGAWFGIIAGAVGSYLKWFFDKRNLRQTYKNEIAKGMTTKILDNLEKYYYHLWGAMAGLEKNLADWIANPTEDNARSAFYSFCIRTSVWRTMATKGVAFILKEYKAENKLQELHDRIEEEFRSKLGLTKGDEQAIETNVEYTSSRQEFVKRVDQVNELAAIYSKYKDWLSKDKESVEKVKKMTAEYSRLFETQITKIYRPWYET